mmetsp:Transcript_90553/g.233693  ORF Transcript_90553/g.233693 Transcript_90553/m.233693 type:complete len:85 (+) Transcript_90553:328-582(+)
MGLPQRQQGHKSSPSLREMMQVWKQRGHKRSLSLPELTQGQMVNLSFGALVQLQTRRTGSPSLRMLQAMRTALFPLGSSAGSTV